MIKRGDLVEFTDRYYDNYPPADATLIKYGVATTDTPHTARTVRVETATGFENAFHIWATSWAGWCPEELEPVLEKYERETPDEFDADGVEF